MSARNWVVSNSAWLWAVRLCASCWWFASSPAAQELRHRQAWLKEPLGWRQGNCRHHPHWGGALQGAGYSEDLKLSCTATDTFDWGSLFLLTQNPLTATSGLCCANGGFCSDRPGLCGAAGWAPCALGQSWGSLGEQAGCWWLCTSLVRNQTLCPMSCSSCCAF